MTSDQRLTIILAFISMVGIPTLVFSFRMMAKWTRVQDKLEELVLDVKQLVEDKDRAHHEIATTIREDRAATDKRLRWLEENLWKGRGRNAV